MRLQEKVAVITGGLNGLGREAALLFAREGARVAVCDLPPEGREFMAAMQAQGGDVFYVSADVSQLFQVEAMVGAVLQRFGVIDILINNAGITRDATLLKMTSEQWNQVIAVNLTGVFHCTRAVAPHMVERGRGKIINTSSIVGLSGNFGQTNYAAAKAGLIGMTKTLGPRVGSERDYRKCRGPGLHRHRDGEENAGESSAGNARADSGATPGRASRRCQCLFIPGLGGGRFHQWSRA
ncbi:MAG: SDR family NAD(P)-dependent oxidoreductase [Candidatus Sulfotelmatobacter sp.]